LTKIKKSDGVLDSLRMLSVTNLLIAVLRRGYWSTRTWHNHISPEGSTGRLFPSESTAT
jgi:hypothetical protein